MMKSLNKTIRYESKLNVNNQNTTLWLYHLIWLLYKFREPFVVWSWQRALHFLSLNSTFHVDLERLVKFVRWKRSIARISQNQNLGGKVWKYRFFTLWTFKTDRPINGLLGISYEKMHVCGGALRTTKLISKWSRAAHRSQWFPWNCIKRRSWAFSIY